MCKRLEGEIIRGVISDDRLYPGIARTRNGTTQNFGERIVKGGKLIQDCDFTIIPPERSWYSKEIDGVWHWVEGCDHCNGNVKDFGSYVRCDKHDVCVDCGIDRVNASKSKGISGTGAVWACSGGWRCNNCQQERDAKRLAKAESRIIPEEDYDELDFYSEYEAKCPWCQAEISTEESYDADGEAHECDECQREFTLTAMHSVTWTTKRT